MAERVKAKAEQERQEMENLTQQQFSVLSESLRQSSQNPLSTNRGRYPRSAWEIGEHHQLTQPDAEPRLWLDMLAGPAMGAGLGGRGMMTLAGKQASNLRAEIVTLKEQKEALEARSTQIWGTFKGLEPYHADGKDYLLTPEGWTIINSGMAGKRDAWRIVRK